ncbi:uncharacterized protein LOC106073842 [Biomphalaria glabrata]|uniref:Uncharacterized protein LOC106073842 n=1 Tax=Biomphalaria glabrata TaxID=6526 RepID=A0A9W3AQB3_BIOGL|nr:uncharacterized protein LOC106073842 [Biomphalaria glabrata]
MSQLRLSFAFFMLLVALTNSNVLLTYDTQQPGFLNNFTCGLLTCEKALSTGELYVEKFNLINIGQNASKLATIFAKCGKQVMASEISLTEKSFNRSMARVQLAIHNSLICFRGSFLCEVSYRNDEFESLTDMSIKRPNHETPYSLQDKMEFLAETITSLKYVVQELRQCPDENLHKDWTLAFRGTSGIKKSVYDAYKLGLGIPEVVESGCKQVGQSLPCANHYRNNAILDNWTDISQVALVLFKDNVKVKQVIFDGAGSNYMNWLTKARVLDSSWSDMKTQVSNIFSIDGNIRPDLKRVFLLNSVYGGCPNDVGWFVAVDMETDGCNWAKNPDFPMFLYSMSNERENYNSVNISTADYFAIFVRNFNLP